MIHRTTLIAGMAVLAVLAGCGESFQATTGSGATGGGGSAGSAQGGTSQGGATTGAAGNPTTSSTGGPACMKDESSDCTKCLFDTCEAPYCACAGSTECKDLIACYVASPTQPPPWAYLEICWQKHASSIALAGSLFACAGNGCPCALPKVDPCTACEFKKCGDQINACFSDADCSLYIKCYQDCMGSGGCQDDCGINNAAGLALAQDIAQCGKQFCSASCPQ